MVAKTSKVVKRRKPRASVPVMIKRYERRLAKLKERAKLKALKQQVDDLRNEVEKG